jgi:hypothetical protein
VGRLPAIDLNDGGNAEWQQSQTPDPTVPERQGGNNANK